MNGKTIKLNKVIIKITIIKIETINNNKINPLEQYKR